uniref:FCP1 homology domain-containing protein n=1 Tax=Kalanchoe fedtschenkoi TaxID=63787 RepID=A0A7N0UI17_KALFE
MQTRRKCLRKSAVKEQPKVARSKKKALDDEEHSNNTVATLITSSVRKQRVSLLSDKCLESVSTTNLQKLYNSIPNEESAIILMSDANCEAALDCKGYAKEPIHHETQTIFSPAFHLSRSAGGEVADSDTQDSSKTVFPSGHNTVNSCSDADYGANLSSEVSAIYLAMKNSKLECVDEYGQDSVSTNVYEEDAEDFDDFDPFYFIQTLPDLSSVVPMFRPNLLPKQTRSCPSTTLVLDLDETLVHSTLEPCDDADFTFHVDFNHQKHTVYVRCRPHLKDFMEKIASLFEIIIFTASQSIYAEQLLNVLDPKRKVFRHRVFRESCVFVEGNYLKDLSVLGRDLAHVIIIDNSPQVLLKMTEYSLKNDYALNFDI